MPSKSSQNSVIIFQYPDFSYIPILSRRIINVKCQKNNYQLVSYVNWVAWGIPNHGNLKFKFLTHKIGSVLIILY